MSTKVGLLLGVVLLMVSFSSGAIRHRGKGGKIGAHIPWYNLLRPRPEVAIREDKKENFPHPDYIMYPRPVCLEVGSFPHPRNCSWFYRCYNHTSELTGSMLYLEYFECAPGTVFSDAIDHCIHGNWKDGCPEVEEPTTTTSTTPTTTSTTTSTTTEVTEPSTTPTTTPTTTPASTTPDLTDCECSRTTSCEEMVVCPDGPGAGSQTMNLCRTAFKWCECPEDVVTVSYCEDGLYYHMNSTSDEIPGKEYCYPPPEQMSCEPPTTPLTPPPPTTPPPPPPLPPFIIFDQMAQTRRNLMCATDNLIPKNAWVQKKFCSSIALCNGRMYGRTINMCKGFYTCHRDKVTGEWTFTEETCSKGFHFDFDKLRCMKSPTNFCQPGIWKH